jgi:hypothetical protein
MNTHTLRVYIYERINDDRLDVWENANDTSLLLRDVRVWWNDYGVDEINIVEDPIGQFGCDKEMDNLVGYFADIRFEIPSHGRCQVPVDVVPNPPEPIVCEPVDIYVGEALAGSFNSGSEVFVKVMQDGFEIAPEDIIVTGDEIDIVLADTIPCADATVNVNGAFWDSVPSGGTENVIVRQSSGSTQVGSIQGQYFRIADSTAVLKTTGGTTISTTSIKAEASANIVAPNTTIEVNGTTEGTFNAGSTVDVQLSDSGGVVTPSSVTVVGNDVQIVLADVVGASVGATLMKTGQTTSYRTGDDGDLEAGRATSFLVLASNNPFGNTNRFTDELGTQTYTNNIVIDWSTYNGSTVLGYDRRVNGGGANTDKTWNNAIDQALAHSIVGYTSGWRLTNRTEALNICSDDAILTWLNYAPFNISASVGFWVSNTIATSTGNSTFFFPVNRTIVSSGKTASASLRWLACRTFTVTGTTLT